MIIGLTGNYGMGKSSVLAEFGRLGAATIDSDRVVGELLRKKSVIAKVRKLLGPSVMKKDGRLDRKAVARIVFHDPLLRSRLEALIHPLVMRAVDEFARKQENRGRIVVVEVPLLFEGGFEGRFDKTITVYTSRRVAFARLKADGISGEDAKARLSAQLPIGRKKQIADYRINNEGTLEQLRRRVRRIFYELLDRSDD